jgi:hypothetical protein
MGLQRGSPHPNWNPYCLHRIYQKLEEIRAEGKPSFTVCTCCLRLDLGAHDGLEQFSTAAAVATQCEPLLTSCGSRAGRVLNSAVARA